MNLNQFRLIVSDLDGTLVKSGSHCVSPDLQRMIADLTAKGIQFTIATGRSWNETKPIAETLNVTTPVIIESGSIIIEPVTKNILLMRGLNPGLFETMDMFKYHPDLDCFRLSASGTFYYDKITTFGGQWLNSKRKCDLYRNLTAKTIQPETFIKFLFVGPNDLLQNLVSEFTLRIQPVPYMILWPPESNRESYLEVFDPTASKGQALKWLVKHLGMSLSEVLAFGDGYNDLDMLQFAGMGVTIHGASPELLSRADLIIPGPQEDGIARFLNGELPKAI